MKTTERRHWLNGRDTRGGWFHTWAWSDDVHGVLFSWGWRKLLSVPVARVQVFKLV